MQRFLGLVVLILFAMPLGLTVAGCSKATATQYCNGSGYGPTYGQVKTITLAANLAATGESLNYGQIGSQLSASAADCVGSSVSVSRYTYATTDMTIADVNPSTGAACAGSWNRNTGGTIADYTVCTPPAANNSNHVAYITASANGATSNPIAVYIHPSVTGVVLGNPSTDCNNDPATNCGTFQNAQGVTVTCNPNTTGTALVAPAYNGSSCLSQSTTGQLVARVYSGTANITCQVGPVSFALQGPATVATLNAQGVATANQPGSALVTATVSNSSSALNSGFISTCPPAQIQLSAVNQPANATSITVGLNSAQAFTATVLDTNGKPLTGVQLEFNSTLPINFPTASSTVTPIFPGTATITAVCQPGSCNPAPFSQIGYLGNGKPITSNGITVTAAGTASTVLYMASTNSQYIVSEDFTTNQLSSPIKLPFAPNSMVISQDGSTLYLGSPQGMMIVATASNSITGTYTAIQGTVLTVAPNNSYVVVTDPTRNTVSLVTPGGAVSSSYNGLGTRAQWSPDSNTLYVTTSGDQLLTYSTFTGWASTTITQNQAGNVYNDVAVTVPSVGAYFAGTKATEGRSYCAQTTLSTGTVPPAATNVFSPIADSLPFAADRLAATTDGKHILAVTAATNTLEDIAVSFPPPASYSSNNSPLACTTLASAATFNSAPSTHALSGIAATALTGVIPASNSTVAFVTYTGTSGLLPLYAPGSGSVSNVTLSGSATAPVAGVFSTDNNTFYAGTSGDNQVHIITLTGTTGRDTGVITPNLPGAISGTATPNLIAQRPRRTTS